MKLFEIQIYWILYVIEKISYCNRHNYLQIKDDLVYKFCEM